MKAYLRPKPAGAWRCPYLIAQNLRHHEGACVAVGVVGGGGGGHSPAHATGQCMMPVLEHCIVPTPVVAGTMLEKWMCCRAMNP